MQLRHVQTVIGAQEGTARISALAWSPNNMKLAAVGADRVVYLFDEAGEKQDKFATKPADPAAPKPFAVKALAWSPDSTKLAVAQTDNIVFVYKLASAPEKAGEWGEKKSICNKFLQAAPVTCMVWPTSQANVVVFGCLDGKVRIGNMKTNKAQGLYSTNSMVVACVASVDGAAIATAHADGSIMRFFFDDTEATGSGASLLTKHSCAPYALSWGEHLVAAGADRRIVFYDDQGRVLQQFEEAKDDKEYTVAANSPSGQSIVVGSYDKLRVFNFNTRRSNWEETPAKIVEGLYTITALAWRPDGSRLAVGTLCGAAELFDCCLRRTRYKGKFDFTYVGPSQVIVKRLSNGTRLVLKSHFNHEIQKVNVLGNDQFLVAHTTDTLLLGDLLTCRLSEVQWRGSGTEKFYFENPQVCMIFNAGELALVQYGSDEILGSVRTEHMNPHLLSVRINDRVKRGDADNRKIAYLVDLKTISIMDLASSNTMATINHDAKIDWLELNESGHFLLFRDKRKRLNLYNLDTHVRSTLLGFCTYVQWVPNSDVIIAQSHQNLCIWYTIESPERVTTFPIKGDVTDIERANGRTEVLVEDGVSHVAYTLDEGLIEFGTAIEDGDLLRAVAFLETLELTQESEAMWNTLATLAVERQELPIAQRAYAAIGDVPKAQFIAKALDAARVAEETLSQDARDHYLVRARLAMLEKHFKVAETIFLEQGASEDAIQMYQMLHRWNDALEVARIKGSVDIEELQESYTKTLTEAGQLEEAAAMKEKQGDSLAAINLYLKSGLVARANQVLLRDSALLHNTDLVERIGSGLAKAGLYAQLGDLYERLNQNQRALEAYRKGNAFRKAVDLCRSVFPNEVVPLEEAWGDYLVSQKQLDAAINHYIEAGCNVKAIEAAIQARQWAKAAQVVEMQEDSIGRKYYKVIADHYAEVRQFAIAQRYYLAANQPRSAIDMYIANAMWDEAHKLCTKYMQPDAVADLYIQQAEILESKLKFKEAEKLYLTVNEADLAINMYKKVKLYSDMIRLVEKHHPDLVAQTHAHVAQLCERDKQYTQAEQHFIMAREHKLAIHMYVVQKMWEDAFRVAKASPDAGDAKQVAYEWSHDMGVNSGAKLLTKLNMLEGAIDVACERLNFDFALELARTAAKPKLSDVYSKQGMYLEDQNQFKAAEDCFLKASRPREAVLMYVHQQDWASAQRVAEANDPESISDVLVGQARVAFEQKDYQRAEGFLLRAHRAELAVRYYKECGMWSDALRLTREYLPNKLAELTAEFQEWQRLNGAMDRDTILATARAYQSNGEHWKAIETYLQLSLEHTNDLDTLEEAWETAADLAIKFVPARDKAVVVAASERLRSIGRHEPAADLLLGIDLAREAVEAYVDAGNWKKARALAAELPVDVGQSVEHRYKASLKQGQSTDDARQLLAVDVAGGLDMLADRGEWDECLKQAAKQSPQVLNKYVALYAAELIKQNKSEQALVLFSKHGAPANPQNFNIYRRIATDLFSSHRPLSYQNLAQLRDFLFTILDAVRAGKDFPAIRDFEKLLLIAHYLATRAAAVAHPKLTELAAKLSVALLRHTDVIAADKAFYEAGQFCIKQGWESMAFVCWNHVIDLCEAIVEGSVHVDNSDFLETDIPLEIPLPEQPALTEAKIEEIRSWVLSTSMKREVEQTLMKDSRGTFVGSLRDAKTGKVHEACALTGYPIIGTSVPFNQGYGVNKDDWNKFLMASKAASDDNIKVSFFARTKNARLRSLCEGGLLR
eukprot:m.643612 g.643612  ORF g.643612 m.643612 type:complete len:1752 (+) comp58351_c0_seq22:791-6046(+)